MTVEVKVPVLAESVPDATLLEWRKRPGDRVEKDEILIELETDKVVLEVPAPEAGVLAEVLKHTGDTVLSQEVLARIDPGAATAAVASSAPEAPATLVAVPAAETAAPAPAAGAERLSPAVRRLVEEHGLDPTAISGTGRDGRLTKADVLAHLETSAAAAPAASSAPSPSPAAAIPASEPAAVASTPAVSTAPGNRVEPGFGPATSTPGSRDERREPMSRLRRRIAERLVEAQHTAAILTTFNEIDMSAGDRTSRRQYKRELSKSRHDARLGFLSFFVKAAVQTLLRRFPRLNAGDLTAPTSSITELLSTSASPSVLDARPDGAGPAQRREAVLRRDRVPDRRLRGAKARDGPHPTIDEHPAAAPSRSPTAASSVPCCRHRSSIPPQSGVLGLHAIRGPPRGRGRRESSIRPMMYVALTYDHRIVDGREAVTVPGPRSRKRSRIRRGCCSTSDRERHRK